MDNNELLDAIRAIVREEVVGQVQPVRESVTALRGDMNDQVGQVRDSVTELRGEMSGQIGQVRDSVADLREEMNGQVQQVRASVAESREEMLDQLRPVRESVVKLEQMPHQIQLIAEAQQTTNEKLDKLQKTIDDMAPTVNALDMLHRMRPHE